MAPDKKFTAHHHETGAENPIPKNGKITFLNMRFCPFAQRAALLLIAKNVDFNIVNVNLKKKPEWFLEANPFGMVPTLVMPDNKSIIESDICADYVDDVFGDEKLTHQDPLKKAQDKVTVALFAKCWGAWYGIMFNEPGTEKYNQAIQNYLTAYGRIEKLLKGKNTKFFFGDEKPGMVDYMIWPFLERYGASIRMFPDTKLDAEVFPTVLAWRERMFQDPVVKTYLVPDEIHEGFLKAGHGGKIPDYDAFCKQLDDLA